MATTITEIKAANKARAEREDRAYWFEAGAMRFFNSRIESRVFEGKGGVFFITSEFCHATDPVRYTVRQALPTGEIKTVGSFQQYAWKEDAEDEAQLLAHGTHTPA